MATLFSKIISGEIPSFKVAENEHFFAFLDIAPVKFGHTLVVPKREEDYIFDLSDEELAEMMIFAKRVAKALKKAVPCKKVGVAVIGLDVLHAHVHLVPLDDGGDLNFTNPKKSYPDEEMRKCAERIASFME